MNNECQVISVLSLRPGHVYYGRGEWHLTVQSIKNGARTVTVTSTNGYGESVTERYPGTEKVGLVPQKRSAA